MRNIERKQQDFEILTHVFMETRTDISGVEVGGGGLWDKRKIYG